MFFLLQLKKGVFSVNKACRGRLCLNDIFKKDTTNAADWYPII